MHWHCAQTAGTPFTILRTAVEMRYETVSSNRITAQAAKTGFDLVRLSARSRVDALKRITGKHTRLIAS
jgi:hypothetical protein